MFYVPSKPVVFTQDKLAVFDDTNNKEKRHAPYELKEITFKNVMGFSGFMILNFLHPFNLSIAPQYMGAFWCLNWTYSSLSLFLSTVNKVELHKDGKNVTLHPRIGNPFTVKIS